MINDSGFDIESRVHGFAAKLGQGPVRSRDVVSLARSFVDVLDLDAERGTASGGVHIPMDAAALEKVLPAYRGQMTLHPPTDHQGWVLDFSIRGPAGPFFSSLFDGNALNLSVGLEFDGKVLRALHAVVQHDVHHTQNTFEMLSTESKLRIGGVFEYTEVAQWRPMDLTLYPNAEGGIWKSSVGDPVEADLPPLKDEFVPSELLALL